MTEPWLIRTAMNEILGPFPKEEILKQIRDGQLGPEDEVCSANGYWIYLDEREEVKKLLGIEPPQLTIVRDDDDEITETQTETLTHELPVSAGGVAPAEIPHLQQRRVGEAPKNHFPPPKPFVLGRVERPNFWRIMTTVLIVVTSALLIFLIRVLQTSK